MKKLTAEKCREQFEEWFAEYAGQTIGWVKEQRASDTHYKTGPEINGYWFAWQASRDALPILEQQERGEGEWIEWAGGERPVIASTRVDIKFRDGDVGLAQNANWDWRHHGYGSDIIAYRIIPERATNQNGEQ